jgi:hypothetical protein
MDDQAQIHLEFFTEDRAYSLTVEPDLFGDLHLTRRWWGRKTGRGNSKVELVSDLGAGLKRLNTEVKRRASHRYVCTNGAQLARITALAKGAVS